MATASSTALAEILGESSSAPTPITNSAPETPSVGGLTSIYDDPASQDKNTMITSSSTSVADYFKQKMQAKFGLKPSSATTLSIDIPGSGTNSPASASSDEIQGSAVRAGIGSSGRVHEQETPRDNMSSTPLQTFTHEDDARSKDEKKKSQKRSKDSGEDEPRRKKKRRKDS